MSDAKHVVYDFEALILCRIIDCSDVRDLSKLGGGVVFEEGKGRDDAGRGDANC